MPTVDFGGVRTPYADRAVRATRRGVWTLDEWEHWCELAGKFGELYSQETADAVAWFEIENDAAERRAKAPGR
jgi:hypothetical protein